MRLSALANIRWVVEDALRFVKREVKIGAKYQGIILDPPAYGRGPDGEKWILEDHIDEIIGLCSKLIDNDSHFFILNLYSMGFSPLIAETVLKTHFKKTELPDYGELFVEDNFNKKLPLGIYARFSNIKY